MPDVLQEPAAPAADAEVRGCSGKVISSVISSKEGPVTAVAVTEISTKGLFSFSGFCVSKGLFFYCMDRAARKESSSAFKAYIHGSTDSLMGLLNVWAAIRPGQRTSTDAGCEVPEGLFGRA